MTSTATQPNLNQQFGSYAGQAQNMLNQGFSLSDIQNSFNKQGLSQGSGAIPQANQPQSHGNWFERLLPTIGGIGGGILGSIAAPFVGTAAGAGIGGALGQEAENLLTGSKGSTMASGLENAAGGLLGDVGGGALGWLAGKAGDVAGNVGAKLFSAQGPGIGEDLAKYATQNLGINDLPTASKFADVLTGDPSATVNPDKALISKAIQDQAASDQSKVDLSLFQPAQSGKSIAAQKAQSFANPNNIFESLIKNNGLSGTNEANALRDQVNGVINSVDNPGSVSKENVLKMQKQISTFANTASKDAARSGNALDSAKARVLNDLNAQLKASLGFDTTKVNPKDAQALANDIITNGSGINKNAANTVANEIINRANSDTGLTYGELRNLESNFVTLKTAAQDAIRAKDRNFGTSTMDLLPLTGAVAAHSPTGILGAIGGKLTSNSALDAGVSKGATKLSSMLGSTVAKKGIPLLARSAAIAAANLPNMASSTSPVTSPALLSQTNNNQNGQNNNQQGGLMNPLNAMLWQATIDPFQFENLANTLAPTVAKAQVAQNEMSQLPNLYQQAGGGQGLFGGLESNILSLLPGTPQYDYMQARQAAAKAGAPFGISPSFMPSFMQTPQAAQSLFGANQAMLSGLAG